MPQCENCQEQMLTMQLLNESHSSGHVIKEDSNSIKHLGKVKCFVCPKCGKVSLFLDDLSRLQKIP
ncbi:MAG: hypothetical protein LBS21_16390 [Clostridiales bacterium]|jgi:predicted RNA-binding Zn-ribbon protein involved in translation (DUF1610 family)|nr:hypothetical protein [Clostridiales bacterium]